jgi:hypothetical protein
MSYYNSLLLPKSVGSSGHHCVRVLSESIAKDQRVYLFASNRMNYYVNKTGFGTFIRSQYPQLLHKKLEKELCKRSLHAFRLIVDS